MAVTTAVTVKKEVELTMSILILRVKTKPYFLFYTSLLSYCTNNYLQ